MHSRYFESENVKTKYCIQIRTVCNHSTLPMIYWRLPFVAKSILTCVCIWSLIMMASYLHKIRPTHPISMLHKQPCNHSPPSLIESGASANRSRGGIHTPSCNHSPPSSMESGASANSSRGGIHSPSCNHSTPSSMESGASANSSREGMHTPPFNRSQSSSMERGASAKGSREGIYTPLCNRSQPSSVGCSRSIFEKMRFEGIACPPQCVTFVAYGGLNNMMIQVNNAMGEFLDTRRNNESLRNSIVLHRSFKKQFQIHLDFGKLAKSCIFTSWSTRWHPAHGGNCTILQSSLVYHATNFTRSRSPFDKGLGITWLVLGAMRDDFRRTASDKLTELGTDYSTLHARFLEGQCVRRHKLRGLSAEICNLQPDFIASAFRALGHTSERLVICTDHQQPALTAKITHTMTAVLSHNTNVISDMMLLIYSKRFVGNNVSTFSENVVTVRHTIFMDTIDLLK